MRHRILEIVISALITAVMGFVGPWYATNYGSASEGEVSSATPSPTPHVEVSSATHLRFETPSIDVIVDSVAKGSVHFEGRRVDFYAAVEYWILQDLIALKTDNASVRFFVETGKDAKGYPLKNYESDEIYRFKLCITQIHYNSMKKQYEIESEMIQ